MNDYLKGLINTVEKSYDLPSDISHFSNFLISRFNTLSTAYANEDKKLEKTREEITRELKKEFSSLQLKKKKEIDKVVLVQARNLKRRDLVWGGLVGNKETSYHVTIKADGFRKMLVIHSTGLWLIYPPFEFNLVLSAKFTNKSRLLNSVFDGEFLTSFDTPLTTKYRYLLFDCLAIAGKRAIQSLGYEKRKDALLALQQMKFPKEELLIEIKPAYHLMDMPTYFSILKELFSTTKVKTFKEDGLIFFPNAPYNPHSDLLPRALRRLTLNPDVCKYKEAKDITIDLEIVWRKDDVLDLYAFDIEKNEKVKFIGNAFNPLTPEMVEKENLIGKPSGLIVEFEWISEINKLRPRMIRDEKTGANPLDTVLDIWEDLHNPLTKETLLGLNLQLVRAYHNRIKLALFDSLDSGISLLDLGSGQGGDLQKMTRFSKIFALEPNEKNRRELERRINLFDLNKKVTVLNYGAEEYERIEKDVKSVQAVSLMLSLSFFWKNSVLLDDLVESIDSVLEDKGKIIFLTINGEALKRCLGNKGYLKIGNLASFRILRDNEIEVVIPDSIVETQIEYLVYLDDFTKRLNERGYTLLSLKTANEEKFLSPEQELYTSLFSYGVYEKKAKKKQERSQDPKVIAENAKTILKNYDKDTINKKQIPSLRNEDDNAPLTCTWYEGLYRIGAIGDGNCFVHAVCKAFLAKYQEGTYEFRKKFAQEFRRDIALLLGESHPRYPNNIYWEVSQNGSFPRLTMNEILNEDLISNTRVDYSFNGLQELFNSSSYLGDEVYSYVSEIIGRDIYVFRATSENLYPHITTKIKGISRNAICIVGDRKHYEIVAIRDKDQFKTVFFHSDPFIQVCSYIFNPTEPASTTPDEEFAFNLADLFGVNGKLQIPDKVYDIFDDDDPFIIMLKRNEKKARENLSISFVSNEKKEILLSELDRLINKVKELGYDRELIKIWNLLIEGRIATGLDEKLDDVIAALISDEMIERETGEILLNLSRY